MRLLAVLAVVASAFSGCLGDGDEVQPADVPPATVPPPTEDATATTAHERFVFDGVLPLAVGTPVVAGNPGATPEQFLFEFTVPEDATEVVVTMTWNATQSTSASLQLLVEDPADGTDHASADGASPLVLALDAAALAGKDVRTRTFASSGGGLAKDQPFTVTVDVVREPVPVEDEG